MSSLERRLVFLSITIMFIAFMVWVSGGGHFSVPAAYASQAIPNCTPIPGGGCYDLAYYGADLSAGGGMEKATGVSSSNRLSRPNNAPWPQLAGNYCFLAVVQALTNYEYWKSGSIPYPHQSSQGPASGRPADESSGQILYDMDHSMKPTFGTLSIQNAGASNQRPFTLANSSYDFGGDPRAQAYASWYETPGNHFYHQYIYHNGVNGASYGLAKGVSFSFSDGTSPEIAFVDQGKHAVVVAGVWSYGNPSSISNASISSFAVYNPWDQNWGSYINGAYYEQVSYSNWTQGQSTLTAGAGGYAYWWKLPYNSNNGSDPDPSIGIYAPGPGQHHWITNYVSIQRDMDTSDNANYCHDENGNVMQGP